MKSTTAAPLPSAERPKSLRLLEAKQLRRRLKADLAPALADARKDADLHQHELAAELGVDQAHVGRWELDHQIEAPNVLAVASAAHAGPQARRVGLAAVEWQAEHYRALVVPEPRDQHGGDQFARMAAIARECGDLVREFAAALANGLDDQELERLDREAAEVIAVAAEVQGHVRAELRHRRGVR